MARIVCMVWLFIGCSLYTMAQHDTLTLAQVDEISYNYYQQQEWQQLAQFGEHAIKNDIDFYYLRLRIGIAYFQLAQYRFATIHLEKAQAMNPFEQTPNDYLYWCYSYNNRIEEALRTSENMTTKITPPIIQSVFAETGVKLSNDQFLAQQINYVFAGLQHRIKKSLTLLHGFTYLQQALHWGNYHQYQYYLKARIPLTKGWYIQPSSHILQLDASPYTKGLYILGNISAEKYTKNIIWSAGYTYSNFFQSSQQQFSLSATWLPLRKNNWWMNCTPSYLITESDGNDFFFSYQTGYNFNNEWMIQLGTLQSGERNFNEQNGFLVYNTLDKVKNRYSFQVNYKMNKRIETYLLMQYETREEFVYKRNLNYTGLIIGLKITP